MQLMRRGLPVQLLARRAKHLCTSPPGSPLSEARSRMATAAADSKPKDAFRKGLPFLFRNNASLPVMCMLLGMMWAYNAYSDANDEEEDARLREVHGTPLADGRVLMQDGSIRKREA
mmetsp:Transcript_73414/g.146050  ORF Transcript_73414/g.146050 Transcript_73414/m.146050 type:complete len:117 (-) Transcript_73414:76-426(-)|eukprot:CAMPEP_0174728682 /NCGR_PEP_ID=MMETSP1094-20130205/52212_1 /TAXON_ID=156173 /ORGANISM="Chrysochromulina brevifilum, Strain UTEX LB 985" /LENGTH=116 /DNA_ID=CAMNT_0015930651 /DNA_START=131 /DNA_END=481 /DNA_ORIENTATION=+